MQSLTEKIRFIESVFGRCQLSRDEKNAAVRCPICDPKDASKKKLIIRITDDITHCWVCGWSSRSLLPLLKKYASTEKLRQYSLELGLQNKSDEATASSKLEIPQDITLLACHDKFDPDVAAIKKYLLRRGVTEKDLWYYRLATSSQLLWKRRVVFLSYDILGSPNFLTGRSIDKNVIPKYVNCDIERNSIVFNEHNIDWKLPLVLCEGPFDLLNCGENATCLLGSELSEMSLLFDRIISNSTPIIIALDSDTYKVKRPRLIKKLAEYDIDLKVIDLGSYPDPGSAPREFMSNAIENATAVDWNFNFSSKLSFINT